MAQKNKRPEVLEGEAPTIVAIGVVGIGGVEIEPTVVGIGVRDRNKLALFRP